MPLPSTQVRLTEPDALRAHGFTTRTYPHGRSLEAPFGERFTWRCSCAAAAVTHNRRGQRKRYPNAWADVTLRARYRGYGPRGGEHYDVVVEVRKPGQVKRGTMRLYTPQLSLLASGYWMPAYVSWCGRTPTLIGNLRLVTSVTAVARVRAR